MSAPSPLIGGPGVVALIMRTRLYRQLTRQQAEQLWLECKAALLSADQGDTVEECEASRTGGLDTLPRGDVLDVLGNLLAGSSWPLNLHADAEATAFAQRMASSMQARGYALAAED